MRKFETERNISRDEDANYGKPRKREERGWCIAPRGITERERERALAGVRRKYFFPRRQTETFQQGRRSSLSPCFPFSQPFCISESAISSRLIPRGEKLPARRESGGTFATIDHEGSISHSLSLSLSLDEIERKNGALTLSVDIFAGTELLMRNPDEKLSPLKSCRVDTRKSASAAGKM